MYWFIWVLSRNNEINLITRKEFSEGVVFTVKSESSSYDFFKNFKSSQIKIIEFFSLHIHLGLLVPSIFSLPENQATVPWTQIFWVWNPIPVVAGQGIVIGAGRTTVLFVSVWCVILISYITVHPMPHQLWKQTEFAKPE